VADGGHVDAGGEQVDGDGDAGVALVFVAAMSCSTLSDWPVILRTAASAYSSPYRLLEGLSSRRLTMSACRSVAQKIRVFLRPRGRALRQLFADDAVEVFVDDAAVEAFDVEFQLVFQFGLLDFAGAEVRWR
jgi:hypothetical protein